LVYAVVLNWNGLDDTLACLGSLAVLNYGRLRVLVVDNGSLVSVRETIERAHPWVEVIENPDNLGYSGGNNVGIRHGLEGGADFVWILNNDTYVEPDSLAELVACAQRHPRAAAVGSKVLLAQRSGVLWMTWGRVTWRQSLISLEGQGRRDHRRYGRERQVEWVPGCSILMRRTALEDLGGFAEEFFAYHEDVDWAARARSRGWEMWYAGLSRIHHGVHGSSGGEASYTGFRKYLSARNSVLYARRHGRPRQIALMVACIAATLPFQYLRRRLRGEQEGIRLKLRGWWDGWRRRPVPFEELGLR
jgi:hypothetical protein